MQEAWDDVSGKMLDPKKVRAARRLEMDFINTKKVWWKMNRREALAQGYRIVGTRWIDVNKGDESKPEYRSRLVGKEFNTGFEEGLFASTPPLEALRWLVSEAATVDVEPGWGTQRRKERDTLGAAHDRLKHSGDDRIMLISDVSRAFFEAPMRRNIAVSLPAEALEPGEDPKETVGILELSLYGTRDAATNFQKEVSRLMENWGPNRHSITPVCTITLREGCRC